MHRNTKPSTTSELVNPPVTSPQKSSVPQAATKKHLYDIKRIPIPDAEYRSETPEHLQNKDLPGFPSTIAAVGPPSSGKTNVLFNLLTRDEFWKGFFDTIYELGPTVESDKIYKCVELPDDQKVSDPAKFLNKLDEWLKKQIDATKQDPHTAPKQLYIFEDITAYRDTIQNSETFVKCFTAIRHHKATAYANIHKLTGLHRTCRVSCMHIMIWPCPRTEVKQAHEDYGVAELSYQDFMLMCRYAWKPDETNPKPFLYINRYANEEKRYRRCFTKVIDWTQFIGLTQRLRKRNKDGSAGMTNWLRGATASTAKTSPDMEFPKARGPEKPSAGDSVLELLK